MGPTSSASCQPWVGTGTSFWLYCQQKKGVGVSPGARLKLAEVPLILTKVLRKIALIAPLQILPIRQKKREQLDLPHKRWAISKVGTRLTRHPYLKAWKISRTEEAAFAYCWISQLLLDAWNLHFLHLKDFSVEFKRTQITEPKWMSSQWLQWELDRNPKLQEIFKLTAENYFNLRVSMRLPIKYILKVMFEKEKSVSQVRGGG